MSQTNFTEISFPEYLACSRISFEWASSYDTKDWARLSNIVLPELHIDYRSVMGPDHFWPAMPVKAYIAMMSSTATLGNPLVGTQHFLGGSTWERTSETEITGTWQLRAHHIRFGRDGSGGRSTEVLASATGHAIIKHFYEKVEGEWKLKGLAPNVLFDEGDLKLLFGMQ